MIKHNRLINSHSRHQLVITRNHSIINQNHNDLVTQSSFYIRVFALTGFAITLFAEQYSDEIILSVGVARSTESLKRKVD